MAAPDYKVRFKDAASMLNYGFSRCSLYIDEKMQPLPEVPVKKGKEKSVPLVYEKQFQYLNTDGETIRKETENSQRGKGTVKERKPGRRDDLFC